MTRATMMEYVVKPQLNHIENLFATKGDEYALTGAFHNFEKATERSRVKQTIIQALEGMQMKHEVSIDDILDNADKLWKVNQFSGVKSENDKKYIDSLCNKFSQEQIAEKFGDFIVYQLLLMAIVLDIHGYVKD